MRIVKDEKRSKMLPLDYRQNQHSINDEYTKISTSYQKKRIKKNAVNCSHKNSIVD
ncbi:hypothetical protein HMPREF9372_3534 [Sporosarcina newyorkensis 2681]|uniref:Uncharacterized protein n=1 Tax=Sporosarcina newyorkensis 2681 TaxID=1027292 RepID=F9DXK3_9BACL|nr:hypothetical protein HMPREF9372_3534 [Sporosarcina newyorkensis 2681]